MLWAVVEDEEETAAETAAAKLADAAAAAGEYSSGKQQTTTTTTAPGKRTLKKVKTMFYVGTEVGSAYLFSVLLYFIDLTVSDFMLLTIHCDMLHSV